MSDNLGLPNKLGWGPNSRVDLRACLINLRAISGLGPKGLRTLGLLRVQDWTVGYIDSLSNASLREAVKNYLADFFR